MGLAASQARFLNLTARKSNLEYEGQQINQQRTALSNQSADLYTQMLGLQVPTPPNTNDYTKVQYTFTVPNADGSIGTISQITKDTNTSSPNYGKYSVIYSYTTNELSFNGCPTNQYSTITKKDSGTYKVMRINGQEVTLKEYSTSMAEPDKTIHQDAYQALTQIAATKKGDKLYFVNIGTEEEPSYQYYLDLDKSTYSVNDAVPFYTAGTTDVPHTDYFAGCQIARDKSNRVTGFTTATGDTYAVTTTTLTDEEAYNDAMNEYTYRSYLYEQQMNNINAKTSIVQAQDKDLELRLKQIDTEHNAIKTEIDAVSSVIKDNSEKSFKTFG